MLPILMARISPTYTPDLDVIQVIDRLEHTTSYGYNSIRQKISETDADGHRRLMHIATAVLCMLSPMPCDR